MKTTTQQNSQVSEVMQPQATKQGLPGSILQAYKEKIVQRQPEEEELLQRKLNNTGLPDNLKSGIENLSGYSMDDVKVHYNSSQPATLQAHAYAQGTDIHIAPGQEKHLPHEAWHVVQQKQGRVKPTMQMKGTVPVNDDVGLEKEADVMGTKAVSFFDLSSNSQKILTQLKEETIQLYTSTEDGRKVSQNNHLLVINPQTAYGHPSNFGQANAIQGQIQFNQGNEAPDPYGELREIVPIARENSDLAISTANFDVLAQTDTIKERAEENYYPDSHNIAIKIMDIMEEQYGEEWDGNEDIETFFGTTDHEKIDDIIQPFAEMIAEYLPTFGNYHESGVDESIDEYMQTQIINQHRPLMPSDCGIMARTILGNQAQLNEHPEIIAGRGYNKGMNIINRENAEWNAHFAAIIMTDGNDHITMENAGAKASQGFGKAEYDRTWYFEMYGVDEGQSFADKYNNDLGY